MTKLIDTINCGMDPLSLLNVIQFAYPDLGLYNLILCELFFIVPDAQYYVLFLFTFKAKYLIFCL